MKFFIRTLIVITLLFVTGCGKTFVFPKEKDFTLRATVNSESLTVGDELIVNATFQNLTNNNYELSSSATFSKNGLVHINLYEIDEKEMFMVGAIKYVKVKGKQEISEQRNFELTKEGKYKVVVLSNFDILNSKTKEKKEYRIKTDTIFIEVK